MRAVTGNLCRQTHTCASHLQILSIVIKYKY